MRNTNANQRVAREIAELNDSGYSARARAVREENIRRTEAASRKREVGRLEPRREWLMRDVCSTPWAEYRA